MLQVQWQHLSNLCFICKIDEKEIFLPSFTSQFLPAHPLAQEHRYSARNSKHVPPLWHGLAWHGHSMEREYTINYNNERNVHVMCHCEDVPVKLLYLMIKSLTMSATASEKSYDLLFPLLSRVINDPKWRITHIYLLKYYKN